MAKCSVFGNTVSHSHRRGNKMWKPNLKKVRIKTAGGNTKRVWVSTSALRSGLVERA